MDRLLYGAAYYDEYMPEERLEKDMQMMEKAGINVIRIAESTWATEEPEEGVFDFHHVTRTIEAAARYGISVIVGTPTYAIPPWLANRYSDTLAVTENGRGKYGARQNMDITNPTYLFYAERIIRRLMEAVSGYENVIGFQLDNETKHYHTAGTGVLDRFRVYLQKTFGTVEAMNAEFGFNYWSNRVDSWEHLPDPTGTINGSYAAEFEKFRRNLVTEFLLWQRSVVNEYLREDQFVTHNFDFEWRNISFGVQPDVNHFEAAEAVTIAGCDIYHPTQDDLTGKEAAFCGAVTRSLKRDNYLVLETEAQGHIGWTPYDGQLRLQAFTHLANGADAVMYWHWHSIHNSFETYWRGLLSHDLEENRLYREAVNIGADFKRLSPKLLHLQKRNRTAILVSNESLTALDHLPMFPLPDGKTKYNDIVRQYADALYELNIEYDIVNPLTENLQAYDLLVVPALYSATDDLLNRLKTFVEQGGSMLMTYKSAYANEYLTVSHDRKPHLLTDCLGITYQEYTIPKQVSISALKGTSSILSDEEREISLWMELLETGDDTTVLAQYEHPFWGGYAAITSHRYGLGQGIYAGCHLSDAYVKELLRYTAKTAGVEEASQNAEFPIIIKSGINRSGKRIHYYFNYSGTEKEQTYLHGDGTELLSECFVQAGSRLHLKPWDVKIIEENF